MSTKLKLIDHLLARTQELAKQDDDEALAVLERLATFHAVPAEVAEMAQASLAEIMVRRKKWTRARRHLAVALLYRPDCARYHYLMAMALAGGRKNDPERAREHYQKALELDPEMTDCLADFGLFCLSQGDADEGIETLQRAVDQSPDDPALLDRLVEALGTIRRRDEARTLLLHARFRHPRDARYEQLWNDFRFQEVVEAQPPRQTRPTTKRPRAELVLLPFVRLKQSAKRATIRRDGPATLPAPHVFSKARRKLGNVE